MLRTHSKSIAASTLAMADSPAIVTGKRKRQTVNYATLGQLNDEDFEAAIGYDALSDENKDDDETSDGDGGYGSRKVLFSLPLASRAALLMKIAEVQEDSLPQEALDEAACSKATETICISCTPSRAT